MLQDGKIDPNLIPENLIPMNDQVWWLNGTTHFPKKNPIGNLQEVLVEPSSWEIYYPSAPNILLEGG